MRSRRSWWLIYGGCAAVVLLALGWVTVVLLQLERSERVARSEAGHQEALRLALWRMDSWVAPLLAREAARPYFDYQPFYPQQRAYTALLYPIKPGEVLTASPLLSYESDYFSLHWQMTPDGRLTSPQAPRGNFRELAENSYLSAERLAANATTLENFSNIVTPQQVISCVAAADTNTGVPDPVPPLIVQAPQRGQSDQGLTQQLKSRQELSKRWGSYQQALEAQQAAVPRGEESVVVGSLGPFWTSDTELIFSRLVRVGDQDYYQGFLCDWPRLRDALLEQITDLFDDARLVPVANAVTAEKPNSTRLATLPVSLEVAAPVPAALGLLSPARSTLILTWLGVLAGMIAVAVTLRASIAFGQKRSRFASAVTHELRTPLTTFRMYSEMLADDMVKDREQRQVYLDTLKDESGRLSNLVENVLAYARLEEGRRPARKASTTLGDVLAQVVPPLVKRAQDADMSLRVENEAPHDTRLTVDVEAVGQILFNLVDNACKYSAGSGDDTVHLTVRRQDGKLSLGVRDHGPGVPPAMAKVVFDPFERGANNDDATPGVGLGLALARGLARDLGGDLEVETRVDDGASFRLTLPVQ